MLHALSLPMLVPGHLGHGSGPLDSRASEQTVCVGHMAFQLAGLTQGRHLVKMKNSRAP